MKGGAAASILVCLLMAAPAVAEPLPPIKASAQNRVPACATPGRLTSFLRSRNSRLDDRFDTVAIEYIRHGQNLNVRWDYAFFQMVLETGSLSFMRNENRAGDVRPSQNNFAGLGATGNGEHGESFPTVSLGVRAHLQHLLLYAGDVVEAPVAERTRKVQEWGVLTDWHKGFTTPITFRDLARKWAPGSRGYASDIQAIADDFYDDFCNKPDAHPEMASGVGPSQEPAISAARPPTGASARASTLPRTAGEEIFRQALERARAEGNAARSGLGATELAKSTAQAVAPPQQLPLESEAPRANARVTGESPRVGATGESAPAAASYNLLNSVDGSDQPPASERQEKGTVQTASAATAARPAAAPPPPAPNCRVWTASYGGQKAVIIRAIVDQLVNYTVLEVNEGQEKRETEAYIGAYAKGGQQVGEFATQGMALDKAFDLCPEG